MWCFKLTNEISNDWLEAVLVQESEEIVEVPSGGGPDSEDTGIERGMWGIDSWRWLGGNPLVPCFLTLL